jgi:hypothetical protein
MGQIRIRYKAKMPCMGSTEEYADLVCVVDCNKNAVTAHR